MRSTPSCHWCRKSKVKCTQPEGDRPCRHCLKAGRPKEQCIPEQLPPKRRALRRQQFTTAARDAVQHNPGDTPTAPITTADTQRDDSLISHSLFSCQDEEILRNIPEHTLAKAVEIFRRKFPELNFLHIASFFQELRGSPRRIILIDMSAILALCARFIPSLTAQFESPRAASEHFAEFVRKNLYPQLVQQPTADLIHGLLLIAQYEWGEGNGFPAWMYTGMAIRMFQGLQAASALPSSSQGQASENTQRRELVWKHEIQRRTIWACFIMDRMVSCGQNRPTMLHASDMTIYLPTSEDDFDLGVPSSNPITYSELIDRSIVSSEFKLTIADYYTIVIRGLDIWSNTCKWVTDGGRRQVSVTGVCPWEPHSTWHQIKVRLDQWRDILHVRLKYPQTPLSIYLHRRQGEHFAFVNLVYYLSVIVLYREYIPFIPPFFLELRGPIDPPLLTKDAPPGWWNEFSTRLFEAAVLITTLLSEMKEAKIPFMTPLVGYSAFSAASINVYLAAFPWVDFKASGGINATDLARKNMEYLHDFADIWPLGKGWIQVATQTQELYQKVNHGRYPWEDRAGFTPLRKSIEQYGTLSVSNFGRKPGEHRISSHPVIPGPPLSFGKNDKVLESALIADQRISQLEGRSPSSTYVERDVTSYHTPTSTHSGRSQDTTRNDGDLLDIMAHDIRDTLSRSAGNDWTTWGFQTLMGPQLGNSFQNEVTMRDWETSF